MKLALTSVLATHFWCGSMVTAEPVCDGQLLNVNVNLEADGTEFAFSSVPQDLSGGALSILKTKSGVIQIDFPEPIFKFKSMVVTETGYFVSAQSSIGASHEEFYVKPGASTLVPNGWYDVSSISLPTRRIVK